jgi:hypothetical protein
VAFRRVEELAQAPLPKALAQVGQAQGLVGVLVFGNNNGWHGSSSGMDRR